MRCMRSLGHTEGDELMKSHEKLRGAAKIVRQRSALRQPQVRKRQTKKVKEPHSNELRGYVKFDDAT